MPYLKNLFVFPEILETIFSLKIIETQNDYDYILQKGSHFMLNNLSNPPKASLQFLLYCITQNGQIFPYKVLRGYVSVEYYPQFEATTTIINYPRYGSTTYN